MSLQTMVASSPTLTRFLMSRIPPALFEQRGPAEFIRHDDERAIADGVVDGGASFGPLAVGIEIDAFREPLVDAPDVRGIFEKLMQLRKRAADHPAVVGRVDTALRHAGARTTEERFNGGRDCLFAGAARQHGRRRDALDHETGVRRRIEVCSEEVDVAVGGLRAVEVRCGEPNALHQGCVLAETRARVQECGGEDVDDAPRRVGQVEAVGVGVRPVMGARGIGDLHLQKPPGGRVVADHCRIEQRVLLRTRGAHRGHDTDRLASRHRGVS